MFDLYERMLPFTIEFHWFRVGYGCRFKIKNWGLRFGNNFRRASLGLGLDMGATSKLSWVW